MNLIELLLVLILVEVTFLVSKAIIEIWDEEGSKK